MVGSHLISRIHIRCKKKKHREIANPKKSRAQGDAHPIRIQETIALSNG